MARAVPDRRVCDPRESRSLRRLQLAHPLRELRQSSPGHFIKIMRDLWSSMTVISHA
jgi:hypothetical protein